MTCPTIMVKVKDMTAIIVHECVCEIIVTKNCVVWVLPQSLFIEANSITWFLFAHQLAIILQ